MISVLDSRLRGLGSIPWQGLVIVGISNLSGKPDEVLGGGGG